MMLRGLMLECRKLEAEPSALMLRLDRIALTGNGLLPLPPLAERCHGFALQMAGIGHLSQLGKNVRLQPGDLVLFDVSAPYVYQAEGDVELIVARLPIALVREHLPSPEFYCGRRLDASDGLLPVVATLAAELCSRQPVWRNFELEARIARHLLELISTSYAMTFASTTALSSVVTGRHAKVRLYIEQHLRDPSLTPCSIATALRLSARYLRMIFATGNETVSAYILRRRLEECARQMADPCWRGHSLSEIAFAWGFNSASHFTRSFRDRYGESPRNYRRSAGR